MADINPLHGIPLEGTHILEAGTDHPDHTILKGDRLIVRPAETAPKGALIVADLGGAYTLWKHDGALKVHGLVVGVVRAIRTGCDKHGATDCEDCMVEFCETAGTER